jgi:hypothetical protein
MRFRRVILLLAAAVAALWLAACSKETPDPVSMGERVNVGHIVYIAFDTQWLSQIGEGPDARIPQNRFFLVRMSATNKGAGDVMVPNLSVEDDSGHRYPELSTDVGAPHWIGVLRNVKPSESTQGNVVFDAPPRHYKLKVTDENGDHIAYIDIPLSFGADAPEMPIPGSVKPPSMPPIRSPGAPATPKKQ